MPITRIELETMTMIKQACHQYINDANSGDPMLWEKRRYEIAKEMLPHFLCHSNMQLAVQMAVEYADALIVELMRRQTDK